MASVVMVTPAQKTLVQASFVSIATIADDAAVLFYQRLFELGHVGFLGKPFGVEELEEQVRAFGRAPRVPARA